jgi:hypothetical protein
MSTLVRNEIEMPHEGRGLMNEPTLDTAVVPHCCLSRAGLRRSHHQITRRAGRGSRRIRRRWRTPASS